MDKTIWALFSIANEYDQPDNNLETFWFHKPGFHDLKVFFEPVKVTTSAMDMYYGQLSRGLNVRMGNTDYRIQEITEGQKLS